MTYQHEGEEGMEKEAKVWELLIESWKQSEKEPINRQLNSMDWRNIWNIWNIWNIYLSLVLNI